MGREKEPRSRVRRRKRGCLTGCLVNVLLVLGVAALLFVGACVLGFVKNDPQTGKPSLSLQNIGLGEVQLPDFMGAVQFLVYGGAVAILIVMAIMLTRREDMAHSNPSRSIPHQLAALVVAGMFLLAMAAVALLSPFQTAPVDHGDTVTGLADLMLTKYVLPFEVVAVLLLIAMIGAIILAKGADES